MPSTPACAATPSVTPPAASPTPTIPSSFVYFANRNTDTGRKLATLLGRFVAGPLALPDEVARELGRDRARADTLSEALIDIRAWVRRQNPRAGRPGAAAGYRCRARRPARARCPV